MEMMNKLSKTMWLLLVVSLGLATACNDAGNSEDAGVSGDGGGDGDGDGGPQQSVFAIVTQVFGADGADNASYVVLTEDLEGDLAVDDAVIEVAGRAIGAGPFEGGALFLAGDGGPTVTRYDLSKDGQLKKGQTVSFLNEGLDAIGEYSGQFQFVSDTRAYFFDGATAKVVIWNPQEMTVDGAVDLPELVMEGATLTFGAAPVRHGDRILAFAGLRNGPAVPSLAAVVVVDTTDDSVEVVTDDRCGYVRDGVIADDGQLYLATEAYGAAVYRLNNANAAAPCLLRFDPDAGDFDDDFFVDLTTLADGAAVGSLTALTDGSALIRVLDEDLFAIADDTHPRVLASAAAWRWATLALGDTPSLKTLNAPAVGGSVVTATLGDTIVAPIFEGRESTTLSVLSDDGPSEAAASISGLAFSIVKLK